MGETSAKHQFAKGGMGNWEMTNVLHQYVPRPTPSWGALCYNVVMGASWETLPFSSALTTTSFIAVVFGTQGCVVTWSIRLSACLAPEMRMRGIYRARKTALPVRARRRKKKRYKSTDFFSHCRLKRTVLRSPEL